MARTIFLTWQDDETRRWYPVARLQKRDGLYELAYTRGAHEARSFVPFGSMSDLERVYRSETLFALFANRILRASRPEYPAYLRWLNLDERDPDPLELLARSGGQRLTDTLQTYPCPERTPDGKVEMIFFCHGIRYMHSQVVEAISGLRDGQPLLPLADVLNPADDDAVAFRTTEPAMMVGYCPRYLTSDLRVLWTEERASFRAAVEKVNKDAPVQFRLLCKVTANWPVTFRPCSTPMFQTIAAMERVGGH